MHPLQRDHLETVLGSIVGSTQKSLELLRCASKESSADKKYEYSQRPAATVSSPSTTVLSEDCHHSSFWMDERERLESEVRHLKNKVAVEEDAHISKVVVLEREMGSLREELGASFDELKQARACSEAIAGDLGRAIKANKILQQRAEEAELLLKVKEGDLQMQCQRDSEALVDCKRKLEIQEGCLHAAEAEIAALKRNGLLCAKEYQRGIASLQEEVRKDRATHQAKEMRWADYRKGLLTDLATARSDRGDIDIALKEAYECGKAEEQRRSSADRRRLAASQEDLILVHDQLKACRKLCADLESAAALRTRLKVAEDVAEKAMSCALSSQAETNVLKVRVDSAIKHATAAEARYVRLLYNKKNQEVM